MIKQIIEDVTKKLKTLIINENILSFFRLPLKDIP